MNTNMIIVTKYSGNKKNKYYVFKAKSGKIDVVNHIIINDVVIANSNLVAIASTIREARQLCKQYL